MKALAKERQRRYDSAIGLANDIERFINHEPVSAGPPSAAYRLRKFVRRNRGRVIAASMVLLALVGGIIGHDSGNFRGEQAERDCSRPPETGRGAARPERQGQRDPVVGLP